MFYYRTPTLPQLWKKKRNIMSPQTRTICAYSWEGSGLRVSPNTPQSAEGLPACAAMNGANRRMQVRQRHGLRGWLPLIRRRCALLAPIVFIHAPRTVRVSPRDDKVGLVYITPSQQYLVQISSESRVNTAIGSWSWRPAGKTRIVSEKRTCARFDCGIAL